MPLTINSSLHYNCYIIRGFHYKVYIQLCSRFGLFCSHEIHFGGT